MAKKPTKLLQEKLKKELIRQEKKLTKRIEELKKEDPFLDPDHVNDNAAVDTDVREQVGHETIEAQILTLQRKVSLIQNAFKKMIKGKYGYCESCYKPIPIDRLKLLPEVRYCIDCERRLIK
jgi:DnaK suppressor protein